MDIDIDITSFIHYFEEVSSSVLINYSPPGVKMAALVQIKWM